MEEIEKIINCDAIGNAFYNLYDRWCDEMGHENIKTYAITIVKIINNNLPECNVTLLGATSKPFGVKIQVGDKKAHIYVKFSNSCLTLCAKII